MTMASVVDATRSGRRRRILMIVENLPVPFDRRVWAEAQSLRRAGYEVSVICPRGPFAESPFESIDSIEIHRHPLPIQAKGKVALYGLVPNVREVFAVSGFDTIFSIQPDSAAALAAVR